MPETFDLLILGGGPGGVAAAIRGSQLGAKVGLIEDGQWGGLCLNRACVPTKLLAATLDRLETIKTAADFGFKTAAAELDEAALWGLKNELVGYFSLGTKGLAESHGVTLIEGRGRLEGPGKIAVGDELYQTESIIVATGSEWVKPEFPGADLEGVINSTQFLEEEKLPRRTLILEGGPWALELAQFLVAAGGQAVVAEAGRNILPEMDQEISQRLRSIINVELLTILNSCRVESVTAAGDGLKATLSVRGRTEERTFDRVIYLERRPALGGLGLETVGLEDLSVDGYLATKAPGIWSVGDVTGDGPALSHRSSALGIVAAENALGGKVAYNPNAVPRIAYTRPQAASVGLTEDEAEAMDFDVITGEASLGVSPMAMIQGQSNGVIKVVGEAKYGELLGVHILAPFATEIITAAALAIQMEATLEDLARSVMPHPTIAESLAEAAREALGWAIYLPR